MNLSTKPRPPLPSWVLEAMIAEVIQQKQRRQFEFRGSNLKIQSWVNAPRPAEFILEGASETGKTYAVLNLFAQYPNKSRVWVVGMDRPGKVLSGSLDAVYFNQCEESKQDGWETLSTRPPGRA